MDEIKCIRDKLDHMKSYGYTLGTDKDWLITYLEKTLDALDFIQEQNKHAIEHPFTPESMRQYCILWNGKIQSILNGDKK